MSKATHMRRPFRGKCITSIIALTAALSLSALAGVTADEMSDGPQFYRDIRPNHWAWNGADPVLTQMTIDKIATAGTAAGLDYVDNGLPYGPGEWTYEFEAIGDQLAKRADEEIAKGLDGAAIRYLKTAAAYYALAKYPHFADNPDQQRAYGKNLAMLERAWEMEGYGIERVAMPFRDGTANGLLLTPKGKPGAGGWPLVVGSNGIDVLKGEFFSFAEDLANRGIAFLAFDITGTGSNSAFPLSADFEQLNLAFARHMGARDTIDKDRIGLVGVSFGGNAIVKLAHTEPELIRAVANICGPVHAVFQIEEEQAGAVHVMYIDALNDRLHLPEPDIAALLGKVRQFSLVDQGVLGKTRKTGVPILSANADGDGVAPPSDVELVNDSTKDGLIIYSGKDDHCPQDRFKVMPEIAEWLSQKLQ